MNQPRALVSLVLVGLLPLVACGDVEEGDDTAASGPHRCYFEYRASYSCSDGDGDPGEWTPTCSDITEDSCANSPDFNGSSDYSGGCVFRSEFRARAWMTQSACEAKLGGPSTNPGPTNPPSVCGNGVCEAGEPASCSDCAPATANLTIANNSSMTVGYVYAATCGAASWGSDRLGSSVIAPGQALTLTEIPAGCWDFKAEDLDRTRSWHAGASTLSGGTTYTWTLAP